MRYQASVSRSPSSSARGAHPSSRRAFSLLYQGLAEVFPQYVRLVGAPDRLRHHPATGKPGSIEPRWQEIECQDPLRCGMPASTGEDAQRTGEQHDAPGSGPARRLVEESSGLSPPSLAQQGSEPGRDYDS